MQSVIRNCRYGVLFLVIMTTMCVRAEGVKMMPPEVMEKVVVDKIWSAVRVGFCLLTHGELVLYRIGWE
jgi:hypothetical protein